MDVSAAQLWQRVTAMPRPSQLVDFPRHGSDGKPLGQVRMRALTQSEITLSAANARRKTMVAIKDQATAAGAKLRADEEIFDNFNACELLYVACIDVDDPEQTKRLFPTPQHIEDNLTTDEIGQLAMAYVLFMADISPTADSFGSDEELETFLDKLAEGGQRTPLAGYTQLALSHALLFSARRLRASRTVSSSPSSLPSSTPNMSGDVEQVTT